MISLPISLAVITLCLVANCDFIKRKKRILYGEPLIGRSGEYSAVLYYTWISNGQECEFVIRGSYYDPQRWTIPKPEWFGCKPHPSYLTCGGSFITPKLVSTACHCVADYDKPGQNPDEEYSLGNAIIYNKWEKKLSVFFGSNEVSSLSYRIPSAGYIVHQKCHKVYSFNSTAALVYDFGWIVLQSSPMEAPAGAQRLYNFAPQYTLDDLGNVWQYAVQKEAICLYLGFGKFEFLKGLELEGKTAHEASPILRHGWSINLNYMDCKEATDLPIPDEQRPGIFVYSDDWANSCGRPFGTYKTRFGQGDSGGPVTCNNYLLGVVSASRSISRSEGPTNWKIINSTMLTADNVYVPYENSINYRRAFIAEVEGHQKRPDNILTFRPRKFDEISSKSTPTHCCKFIITAVAIALSLE